MYDPFSPRPHHMLFPVGLFVVGTLLIMRSSKWLLILGFIMWAVAWLIIAWIILASAAEHRARYWDAVASAIDAAGRSDLDRLAALGFTNNMIRPGIKIELNDRRDGMNNTTYAELPLSDVKLRLIAKAVRNGEAFTERVMVGDLRLCTSDDFRKLRSAMRDQGYLVPRDYKDHRQGFMWTESGRLLFDKIAEEESAMVQQLDG